ncbi:MAG: hypothetical protein KJ069_30060 [Anaerolineae bacterium]|nr:hypothetical protein [Anaerolineae bacterium]
MNTNSSLYRYRSVRSSLINAFIFATILIIPLGCVFSLIFGIILAIFAEKFFSWQLPSVVFPLLFFVWVSLSYFNLAKNQLSFLEINNEVITLKTWYGNRKEVRRNAVKNVTWNRWQAVINNHYKILFRNLPLRTQVEFIALFLEWVPEESLPDDTLAYLRWKKQIKAENMNSQNITTRIAPRKRRLGWPRSMSMDESGIIYSSRGKQSHFFWNDIEAIAFQLRTQKILIWQGERHAALSYKQMDDDAVNDLYQGILKQTVIKDIPFALV